MEDSLQKFKRYFTMGEVTHILGVNASLVRFWHKEFNEFLHPKTNKKGNRLFTPKDVETLRVIHYLVKEKGFTLEGAKKEISGKSKAVESSKEIPVSSKEILKENLLQIRNKLIQLKELF